MPACTHRAEIAVERPGKVDGCVDCLAIGGRWVHLRVCRICGHVGCCDSSPNRHATGHAHTTEHPIVTSVEPGEYWSYCYADDLMFELDGDRT
ncbi:MAG TPA: UBP-type zinc finger domain-containing protein [Solirubrobacteraceae bacterium]|nr:UBP-type zinc finger domain-containing protein [Solirubrobacteraceae bacterium]